MLIDFDYNTDHVKKEKRSKLGKRFAKLQRALKETESSMLVIVDGWESSGKGFVLTDLTRELDPRYFEVSVFQQQNTDEEQHPFLWRFVKRLPGKGEIAFFNRSFYYSLFHDLDMSEEEIQHELMDISLLERLLVSNGTLVVKLFLNHTEDTMRMRIENLQASAHRHFFVTKEDVEQLNFYSKYHEHMSSILEQTSFEHAPWKVISTENQKNSSRIALNYCIDQLENHLALERTPRFEKLHEPEMIENVPALHTLDLKKTIPREQYKAEKETLQRRAGELLYQLWLKQIPCIIVLEGTDAAGKGGAIRRLRRRMDPRHYDVATTAAPTREEDRYHYLWRFYKTMPRKGRMTIYDRSWYGRVLVERVEGFTKKERWQDAYHEINEMEHNLIHEGALFIKFLIVIDKDEQRKRLEERENDPEKRHKLTEEDWRNHERFDDYEEAMNDMIANTSTKEAPWTIVEGNQKYFARTKVLETFIKKAEEFLGL